MTIREWLWIASAPVIYCGLLALGHWLKRRWGVRLGIFYHLLCLCTAVFVPMPFLNAPESLTRAFATAVVLLFTLFALAILERFYFGQKRQTPVPKFVSEVFNLVLFVLVLLVTLNVFYSVEIPHLIAGSGVLAIILGFAMQDTLGNILAGLALHFEKPYRVGDWLIVDNRHAQVTEVNWRATRLRTNDDIYLDIPNSQLARTTIVNLSYPTSIHAMRLRVGLEYGSPPNDVKDALLHATTQAAAVLKEPAPKVFLAEFGESAVVYEIKYWLSDHARFNEITDAVRTNVWYELARRGLRVPFPIRTIQMAGPAPEEKPEALAGTRQVLRSRSLFAGFSDGQLDELLSGARRGRYGRGESIIEQGEEGASMFVLLDGAADVLVSTNGEATRVAGLGAGDCFGEMSLLNGEPRSATVRARTDCVVMEISKASVAQMLERSPELLQTLSEMLARRRLENEGALAESAQSRASTDRQRQYSATFLTRLKSFFDL